MAKQINVGVGGVVKKVSKPTFSVGGVVKTAKKGVCGVGGVVKEFYAGEYVLYDRGTNYAGLTASNSDNEVGTQFIAIYTGSSHNVKLPSINYANYSSVGVILSTANKFGAGADYPQIAFYTGSTVKTIIMNTGQKQLNVDDTEMTFMFDISSMTETATYNLRVRPVTLEYGTYEKRTIKLHKIWLE